ncbi:HK97 gp10 family phage protein [Silvibacterium bohemicum]|uniref:HK97 gp10 family phage protein n=1 Tax=Silvibacterium bohemicum TaxID=1577686 RepID=A0A841K387_9BACT|nr:HK97-gp10 family putative phage morphogenesis protein [Silvibacterium bohemicum]MBB6144714.1 HK97 gp10 family phage protein [Silvibacterium bohemicum]
MADGLTIDIQGLDQLQQRLTEMGTTAADRCVRTALRAGAIIEQSAIVARTPVRPELPSGTALPIGAMAADIVIRNTRSDQGNLAAIVGPDSLTRHVALWVTRGHRLIRGGRSRINKRTGKVSGPGQQVGTVEAHPFVTEAWEQSRQEVTSAIITTLQTEIDKEAKKRGL